MIKQEQPALLWTEDWDKIEQNVTKIGEVLPHGPLGDLKDRLAEVFRFLPENHPRVTDCDLGPTHVRSPRLVTSGGPGVHLTAEGSAAGLQLGVAGEFVRLDTLVSSDRGPRFGDLRVVAVPLQWRRLAYGTLRLQEGPRGDEDEAKLATGGLPALLEEIDRAQGKRGLKEPRACVEGRKLVQSGELQKVTPPVSLRLFDQSVQSVLNIDGEREVERLSEGITIPIPDAQMWERTGPKTLSAPNRRLVLLQAPMTGTFNGVRLTTAGHFTYGNSLGEQRQGTAVGSVTLGVVNGTRTNGHRVEDGRFVLLDACRRLGKTSKQQAQNYTRRVILHRRLPHEQMPAYIEMRQSSYYMGHPRSQRRPLP